MKSLILFLNNSSKSFLNNLKNRLNLVIFIPLFIYLGKRSLVAYDEGYYVLQARWILDKDNWIAPLWFDKIVLDRTIAIQFLIAGSQRIFGETDFSIFLPILIASLLMLFLTYQIHKELLGYKNAIISSIILSTTLLWINYANMASQDILFATIITFGIFGTIKSYKTNKDIYFLFSGIWIGLGFMFKTFLVCIPLLAILPFLINKKIILRTKFWLGILLGFLPFIIWSFLIISNYNFETYNGLFEKFLILSKNNTFTNPFYYYVWNFPFNIFPWTIFGFAGFLKICNINNGLSKYFLFYYPIFILIILSLFSTKTPYYPLQILSLTSINAYLGIQYIGDNKQNLAIILKFLNFKFIPFILICFVILVKIRLINLDLELFELNGLLLSILIFSISWLSYNFLVNKKRKLFAILLGPYILFISIFQSGLITDRSRSLRLASEQLINKEKISETYIKTIKTEIINELTHSKIIKILLNMPKIGDGIESLDELGEDQYAWTTSPNSKLNEMEKIKIINESEEFFPWKLIYRK